MVKDITLLDGSKMVWLNGKVSAPGFETRKLCYSKNPADPSQAYVFDEQGENGPITIPSESPKSQGS